MSPAADSDYGFAVPSRFPVHFTRSAWAPENPLTAEVVRRLEPERRHRVLVVIDDHVARAHAGLTSTIRRYFDSHRDSLDGQRRNVLARIRRDGPARATSESPFCFHRIMRATAALACFLTWPYFAACGVRPDIPVDFVDVSLVAQKQSWQASYLVSQSSNAATEVPTGREVHVPVGAFVRLRLASRYFVSDFRINALELRDFAAPGLTSELVFHANRQGRFEVRGEEMCGRPHTDRTRGWLVVEDVGAFQAWIRNQIRRDRG